MENTITLVSGQKIDILLQDEVSLDIDCSLRYIESGKKEIEEYVENVSKKHLYEVVDEAQVKMSKQIEDGVLEASEKASISAKKIIDENINSIKTEIDSYIINEVKPDIEQNKDEVVQSAQIASQAAQTASDAYDNLRLSLELAQDVAGGNIGDIKYTLRTSAPHGAVFCNGQILTEEQYPDLYEMLQNNRLMSVSTEEYNTQVSAKGQCEFFSIDEILKTIRVPTIIQDENSAFKAYVVCYTGKDTEIDIVQEICLNNPFSLLDYKWSEYELNNASWLISNGIFQSGTVYKSVYNLLLKIQNGTETKDGVSVKLSTEAYADTDFVINTADTTFRLPTKVKLASGSAVFGNGMALGLTNGITNASLTSAGIGGVNSNMNNAWFNTEAYGQNINTTSGQQTTSIVGAMGVTADADNSGIETSSSGLKLYFYVGETNQDANLINSGGVLSELANKVGFADKEVVVGWGIPDYSAGVSVICPIQDAPFVAPCDGVYVTNFATSNSIVYLYIDGVQSGFSHSNAGSNRDYLSHFIPLPKGATIYWNGKVATVNTSMFYPFKGVN